MMSALLQSEGAIAAGSTSRIRSGVVTGYQRYVLMLEGALVLIAASFAYARLGGGWLMFVLLFGVPDASMLGYLAGPKIGASIYNLGHSYVLPAALAAVGIWLGSQIYWLIALIWVAHIGLDRMFGIGLKYDTGFKDTHLAKATVKLDLAPSPLRSSPARWR